MKSWWCHHCFSQSVCKTCQRQPTALKLSRLIVYPKFHKICQFENHVTRNDFIMMSLPKTMENNGKMRTSMEPNKIYIVRKDLMKVIQKCNFYWIWATVSKVMGIYVKFYHDHSPNMVLSRDPKQQISKILFFVWFHIKFQEMLLNLGGIGSRTKKLQAKTQCL